MPLSKLFTKRDTRLRGGKIIGTQPVIFDIRYTPYRLKINATAAEIAAHKKERAFYDFTGEDNHYKYITTEGKIISKETKWLTLHILRHTYATRLEEAGIPPKVKQYLLGHASLDMTQNVYTDTQMHYVESVSDSVRALF